tara:strand:+ start:455 stop:1534 length:1080 start_codon:yes stop_codon:yes gene_type:complete
MDLNKIVLEDLDYITNNTKELDLNGSKILITGCAGFLGYYFTNYLALSMKDLGIKKIIALDSFLLGHPIWLDKLRNHIGESLEVISFTLGKDNIKQINNYLDITHIIHMASIASPTFYRQFPLETVDANVWGLRDLFDSYLESKKLKGFLFFSSSEIYGDPDHENIPTKEDYRGFVSCTGPRACYDESKRFGETLCSIYRQKYNMPITIVRPFNNYGPGMKPTDKRLPADLANCILENKDIIIYSNGRPTRTFCYVADAICGFLKALFSGKKGEYNIGIDNNETSVYELADIFRNAGKKFLKYNGQIIFKESLDKNYLNDNPQRRCPNIDKARKELLFNPKIPVVNGVEKYLNFLLLSK